jgi:hypothetical protein
MEFPIPAAPEDERDRSAQPTSLGKWPGLVIHCPDCGQLAWTFTRDSEEGICRFCGTPWWKVYGWRIAQQYADNIRGDGRLLSTCPSPWCGEEAFLEVTTRENPDEPAILCFECGFLSTADGLGVCDECGRATIDPGTRLCTDCQSLAQSCHADGGR